MYARWHEHYNRRNIICRENDDTIDRNRATSANFFVKETEKVEVPRNCVTKHSRKSKLTRGLSPYNTNHGHGWTGSQGKFQPLIVTNSHLRDTEQLLMSDLLESNYDDEESEDALLGSGTSIKEREERKVGDYRYHRNESGEGHVLSFDTCLGKDFISLFAPRDR